MNTMAHPHDHINWMMSRRRPYGRRVGTRSMGSSHPLASPLQPHASDRLGTTRSNTEGPELPGRSQGADCIDQGERGPCRSILTEALTGKAGVSWIRAAKSEVNHPVDEAIDNTLAD